jgi:hypothetical protein
VTNIFARIFLGKPPELEPVEPHPGIGGYTRGAGPANQTGYPGSTTQTRTNRGVRPRDVGIRADTDTGANSASGTTLETRQVSYRGDIPGARTRNPRTTQRIVQPQTVIRQAMQHDSGGTFFGGPMLHTGPGNNTAGGHPLGRDGVPANSMLDTATPYSKTPFAYPTDTPGGQNCRNTVALKYKTSLSGGNLIKSAPRADQAPVNPGGQATDGNVHPDRVTTDVASPGRFVFPNQGWNFTRQIPYGTAAAGIRHGTRGASLDGTRYYATQTSAGDTLMNAGQGRIGERRLLGGGSPRPVSFTQPAPWTANFRDQAPAGTGHQPDLIYTSPQVRRSGNRTQRG